MVRRLIVSCDSSWRSEQWPFFGVEKYPAPYRFWLEEIGRPDEAMLPSCTG